MKPGLFVYHCATAPVVMHVANGLYGLVLVEPAGGLPAVDREFYLMRSEFYTEPASDLRPTAPVYPKAREQRAIRIHGFAHQKALAEDPDYVVWNGRVDELTGSRALEARVGERVRFFVGNAGPNLGCAFHIIGDHLERVWPEGSTATKPLADLQTWSIAPGSAAIVETVFEVPGDYLLVDHALGRSFGKGGLAVITVKGPPSTALFQPIRSGLATPATEAWAIRLTAAQRAALAPCATCHDLSPSRRPVVGPPLHGIFGRRPVSPDMPFEVWNHETLDQFLLAPSKIKPRTPMTYSVPDPEERQTVIEALRALGQTPESR